ncbi:MAG: MBL fold metallo-hydrolase [Chromatiales bacterium]|jgi:glyoxylase-like metal-dependent hydrolase (beta-lactamase superfamily II)|nr:MBL fold metallo-hydrolase [Chromatiales bacterium]
MTVTIHTIPLGFDQCYVVRGDGVIVIDAGQPGKAADFASELAAAGIDSSEVRLIVLTHGHWDHIGSAMEIRALTGAPMPCVPALLREGKNSAQSGHSCRCQSR